MISNFFYTLGYFNKHNWYNEIKTFDLTDNNVIEMLFQNCDIEKSEVWTGLRFYP